VTMGLGGGTLSAFLTCTAYRAIAQRVLEQSGYIDLAPPLGPPLAAPQAPSATEQHLPEPELAVSAARA
jgi:hypothetical protein